MNLDDINYVYIYEDLNHNERYTSHSIVEEMSNIWNYFQYKNDKNFFWLTWLCLPLRSILEWIE